MADVRRAYRRWFLRRMSWLSPGLIAAVTVVVRLAVDRDLDLWLRLPALALSGGVAALFAGLALLPALVLASRSRGDWRRAQALRREFRSYPVLALMSLSVALVLLAVPLLFGPSDPPPAHPRRLAVGPRSVRTAPPAADRPGPAVDAAAEPAPPEVRPLEAAAAAPSPVPAVSPVQDAPPPALKDDATAVPLTPLPPAPRRELPAGEEEFTLKSRPEIGDLTFPTGVAPSRGLDRAGLPDERDPDGWPMPEVSLNIMAVPDSGGWYGALYEAILDIPVSVGGSLRLTYMMGALSDEQGEIELEATITWHRATVEYEQRLVGYTRKATFDLAVRVGLSLDRFDTHEAEVHVSDALRPSPCIGLETALWEQDGLGLVMQAGHSIAFRVDGAASSVTDVRLELRIDLSERASLQLGWRYVALRVHDRGSVNGVPYDELERSLSGPIAGLAYRF